MIETKLKSFNFFWLLLICLFIHTNHVQADKTKIYKVLIIDGQNNHRNMADGTVMMKRYLEETGLFTVEVATTPKKGENMDRFQTRFFKI